MLEYRKKQRADPNLERNTHKVEVKSDSAEFEMSIQNVQTPENPGTGSSREGAGVAREPQARGSQRSGPAPAVGNRAPDFTLPLATDPKQLIQLSGFAGKKPVALIFGSYT